MSSPKLPRGSGLEPRTSSRGVSCPAWLPDAYATWPAEARHRAAQLARVELGSWGVAERGQFLQGLGAPAAEWWDAWTALGAGDSPAEMMIVSVGGLPGTGKSTLARLAAGLLETVYSRSAVTLSMDDLYLTLAQRQALAEQVHPLLRVRGVPGTHDVQLGLETLARLSAARPDERVRLPRFDKLADDRLPLEHWPVCVGRPEIVILEGWFFGARVSDAWDAGPLNEREAREDPEGVWRAYVRERLGEGYPELFALSQAHVQLEAPSFGASIAWRTQQGQEELVRRGRSPDELQVEDIARFLALFERVARCSRELRWEVRVQLGQDHQVLGFQAG